MPNSNPTHFHFNSLDLPAAGEKFPMAVAGISKKRSELTIVWTLAMTWQSIATPDTNGTDGFNYLPAKNFKMSTFTKYH